MVHFVCPPNCFYVFVVAPGKPFETLVDNNFMHNKISRTIHGYACADTYRKIILIHTAKHDAEPTWYGKNEEEGIVLFKKTIAFLVMVLVQVP